MALQLSKSEYMMFLRHPAWLWLKKHDKSKLPPVDANTQAIFDGGFLFEEYAEKLFPKATTIGFDDYQSYLTLPHRTKEALSAGPGTYFQGRLEHEQITCIFDVVTVVEHKTIDLYEIKSSTGVKPDHKLDLAFQLNVLEGASYHVRKIYVIHVNNQYTRNGDIDISEFTTVVDVTEDVKEMKEQTLQDIHRALAVANSLTCPDISPSLVGLGSISDWLAIYRNLVPIEEGSVYELASPTTVRLAELEILQVKKLTDIPDGFALSEAQARQVSATKLDRTLIDPDKIREFLDSFEYPLYFLDYETMASVVPAFDAVRPYQQVPFQYSLHILDSPTSKLRHKTYLHSDNSNPMEALSDHLQKHIGTEGTVLAWYASFEKACNTTMGNLSPEFLDFYQQLNERIQDLMIPFSSGWYVHKDFHGSASIKQVLPVLAPDLSYADLDIHEGGSAQRLWMQAVLENKQPHNKAKILKDLDVYCTMDTMAMVRIFEVLQKVASLEPEPASV